MSTIQSAARITSLLVFDDDHGVAQVAQLFEHLDQAVRIARVESDGGLVEDVERSGEVAAQRRGEVDALALATREGRGETVERQIAQPHVREVLQAVADFDEDACGGLRVVLIEQQAAEEGNQARPRASSPGSAIVRPPTRTYSASFRRREPPHSGQTVLPV